MTSSLFCSVVRNCIIFNHVPQVQRQTCKDASAIAILVVLESLSEVSDIKANAALRRGLLLGIETYNDKCRNIVSLTLYSNRSWLG